MVDAIVPALREAARHRGFRLLVSKKRTPGVGDHGKFGLADNKGKSIFGVGVEGLTASPSEIESFLRGGELETWRKSASLAPDKPERPRRRAKAPSADAEEDHPVSIRKTAKAPQPPEPASPDQKSRTQQNSGTSSQRAKPRKRTPLPAPKHAKPRSVPPPLRVRKAKPSDSEAIIHLLRTGGEKKQAVADLTARMSAFAKPGNGLLVAEQGSVIGCLAWTQSPSLHRPLAGRIATLFVAERHRRSGIGRALIEEAAAILANAGIVSIEAMSDIDIRSAHGFFRKLDFSETSYRFAKTIAKPR